MRCSLWSFNLLYNIALAITINSNQYSTSTRTRICTYFQAARAVVFDVDNVAAECNDVDKSEEIDDDDELLLPSCVLVMTVKVVAEEKEVESKLS